MNEKYTREWWKERLHLIQAFVEGKEIQFYNNAGWETCERLSFFNDVEKYRIKPKTRIINGFEVPAPVDKELEDGTQYYVPEISSSMFYENLDWMNDNIDYIFLKRGLVFLNKEDAIVNAKAMLGIDPNKR